MATQIPPVTVLTGFLGSGKTTLLNRILRGEHGLRIGVLVNDFGDVNVDARLVAGMEGDTLSLTNGCVCCTMRGGLIAGIRSLLERPAPPDAIVIEASGISDPINIVQTFRTASLSSVARLDGVITVVDAEQARNPRFDTQLVHDQIATADIVILNKVDLVHDVRRRDVEAWIKEISPRARILRAVQADVPLDIILGVGGTAAPVSDEHNHDHALAYASWTYRCTAPLAYRALRQALESLPPAVYRAKGVVRLADAPNMRFVAQVVGKRVAIDIDGPWGDEEPQTELVFIALGPVEADGIRVAVDAARTDVVPLLNRSAFEVLKARRLARRVPASV